MRMSSVSVLVLVKPQGVTTMNVSLPLPRAPLQAPRKLLPAPSTATYTGHFFVGVQPVGRESQYFMGWLVHVFRIGDLDETAPSQSSIAAARAAFCFSSSVGNGSAGSSSLWP